jgi:pilus assembly protein Flp/PilA
VERGECLRSSAGAANQFTEDDGVTAIEDALIASLIAVFIIAAVRPVSANLNTVFTEVGNSLK